MHPGGTAQSRAGDEVSPSPLQITTLDPIPDQPGRHHCSFTVQLLGKLSSLLCLKKAAASEVKQVQVYILNLDISKENAQTSPKDHLTNK